MGWLFGSHELTTASFILSETGIHNRSAPEVLLSSRFISRLFAGTPRGKRKPLKSREAFALSFYLPCSPSHPLLVSDSFTPVAGSPIPWFRIFRYHCFSAPVPPTLWLPAITLAEAGALPRTSPFSSLHAGSQCRGLPVRAAYPFPNFRFLT